MVTKPGTYLEADESPVEFEDAVAVWAPAAYAALRETATRYRATMTYKELGEAVQRQTGIRTRTTLAKWIVPVLAGVARECIENKEPLLIALCVTADGSVAAGYDDAVKEKYEEEPKDLDVHAAAERLNCYRFFGAELPGRRRITGADQAGRREEACRRARPEAPDLPDVLPRASGQRCLRLLRPRRVTARRCYHPLQFGGCPPCRCRTASVQW